MNDLERYTFDLNGYLLVKGVLTRDEATHVVAVADALHDRFASSVNKEPQFESLKFKTTYHYDEELGTSHYDSNHGGAGVQYVVDDILNADPAFDLFVGHVPTMNYIREMVESPVRISSSELRYRHKGNITGTHMGGPTDVRNEYRFGAQTHATEHTPSGRHFDLLTVRVLYALHDIPVENGPLCVVPGSHKANYRSPFGADPLKEPGMVPLPMEAGDALYFTENLRHGGYPNVMERVRRTVHICYAPAWVGSQSPAHWDGVVHVTKEAWSRYTEEQRALLPTPAAIGPNSPEALSLKRLQAQIEALTRRNAELEAGATARARGGLFSALRRLLPSR